MKEKDVRQKLFRFARELGYWPITQADTSVCPRCKARVKPKIGRPDMLWLHPSKPSSVCEVKVLRANQTSFPFSEISPEQRQWLDRWADDGGVGYIGFGAIRPNGKRHRLANLYLVPWLAWCEVERAVMQHQGSIPYTAGKGYAKELQELGLDIVTQFAPWELQRKNNHWVLPTGHPEEAICQTK